MNNRLYNNETSNKLTGLFYSGVGLIVFAFTCLYMLTTDRLMPMFDGSFMAEMFPGVDATTETAVLAIFGTIFGVIAVSYVVMVLLGMNAIRLSKNPEGVKPHTSLAMFLVFTGIISLLCVATEFKEGATLTDNLKPVLFAGAHVVFAICYLFEAKAVKKEVAALCA